MIFILQHFLFVSDRDATVATETHTMDISHVFFFLHSRSWMGTLTNGFQFNFFFLCWLVENGYYFYRTGEARATNGLVSNHFDE